MTTHTPRIDNLRVTLWQLFHEKPWVYPDEVRMRLSPPPPSGYVSCALLRLVKRGLLSRQRRGCYVLTNKGGEYMAEDQKTRGFMKTLGQILMNAPKIIARLAETETQADGSQMTPLAYSIHLVQNTADLMAQVIAMMMREAGFPIELDSETRGVQSPERQAKIVTIIALSTQDDDDENE